MNFEKHLKSTNEEEDIKRDKVKKGKERMKREEDILIVKEEPILGNNKDKKRFLKKFIKRLNSIRTKLIFAFLVPVLLIILLGVISYSKASKGLIESYETSTLSTMNYMAKYLNFGIETVAQKANYFTSNDVMIKYYSGYFENDEKLEAERLAEVKASVSKDILSMGYISNVYIFSNYGEGFSGSGLDASKLVFDDYVAQGEAVLLEASETDGLWIGKHPYLDDLSRTDSSSYALSYMSYLYDILHKQVGCIVLNVSYKYVNTTISESGLPNGSVVAFITNDDREIVSGDIPEGFKFTDQKYYQDTVADKESQEGSKYVDLNGKNYLFTYSKIDVSGSIICSLIPKSVIVAKANEVKYITLLMVIVASIIAISLGTYMAYGFSNTIKKVNSVLKKTESGDLTCYTQVRRKDEFRILGKSINDMIGSMQQLIRKMTGTSNTVSQSALVVSKSSTILVSATENISDAVNDIENGVTQQAVDAESCLHQMADLAEKINKLYSSTHNIEQIAGTTEQIVSTGMSIVDNLSMKAKDTKNVTNTVISDIENLEMESKAISGIIETINGIAEQTNLLSLNASIEAARAGEYGSGFSVVALEIRKLADQSLKSSGEIATIIKRIEDQTKKTVKTAKHAENIVLSQEEALTGTVNIFTDINKHVENLSEILNEIVVGAEGIENAKNDTLKSIESISATTQETAAATEELSVIAVNQLNEVNKLNDVVQQLNDDAGSLAEAVRAFMIN